MTKRILVIDLDRWRWTEITHMEYYNNQLSSISYLGPKIKT